MIRGLLLVVFVLVTEPSFGQSSCIEVEAQRSSSDNAPSIRNPPRELLKRYNDLDYDSFVGLMGRRSTDLEEIPSPVKREMHDIFVGLMGRRSSTRALGVPGERSTQEQEASSTNAS
ncbi:tachykinin-3a isoform X1 [Clupea harengus]|uniref:Tachykinin-3a isoform X1 n=1 Tax=Clupea harengus TaxID=7950 RepID=A0A8M1KP89_CLUHA|nr:tachykinin-3a isoform X1 [Clupea harengus]